MGTPRLSKQQKNGIFGEMVSSITDIWIKVNLPIMAKHHIQVKLDRMLDNSFSSVNKIEQKLQSDLNYITKQTQSFFSLFDICRYKCFSSCSNLEDTKNIKCKCQDLCSKIPDIMLPFYVDQLTMRQMRVGSVDTMTL